MSNQRWPYRYHLSTKLRLRRSLYEILRDQLDLNLLKLSLMDSYANFKAAKEPYPFVLKRELKPRARGLEQEYDRQNHFLILFCEGSIPSESKKYIRFFDSNKLTKESIERMQSLQLHSKYTNNLRYFNNPSFGLLIKDLSKIDYALLIQNDPSIRKQNRYMMTHFHVRIDWPIDHATEDMAHEYRYIAKELYEKGEDHAQALHHKLFENYGFHHAVGGRRTAAVVAAQFLKRMSFISTIYVSSSEARTLTRISERGVSRFVLLRLPMEDIKRLALENGISLPSFMNSFLLDRDEDSGVGILHIVYRNGSYSKPPEDGKLRRLHPDYQWLSVHDQLLIPLPGCLEEHPVRYNVIYSQD